MSRSWSKLWIVFVALALVAAACGGDENEADAQAGGDQLASTDADTGGAGQTDDGAASGSSASGDPDSEWCRAVRSAADGEASPLDLDLLGLTPEELEARFTENVALIEEWEATAPPEIEADVTAMADAFRTLVSLADAAEWDLLVMGTDPAFLEAFDVGELGPAADRIDAYSRDVCGVDLGVSDVDGLGGGTSSTPSVPAVGADGDLADQVMGLFGLSADVLAPDQVDCLNEQLGQQYPDGIPADAVSNEAFFAAIDQISVTCDLSLG